MGSHVHAAPVAWGSQLTRFFRGFATSRQWHGRRYLLSPLIDFLMVGGLGLIILPLLTLFVPETIRNDMSLRPYSVFLAGVVTYHVFAINYPHFAASYQIAYQRLPAIRDRNLSWYVRWRYAFALVGFPLVYVAYCAYALGWAGEERGLEMLGLLVNLMFLTVGWHYAKQSFGILMVLSALKGFYFSRSERALLLVNVLVVWVMAWIGGNLAVSNSQYWGLRYMTAGLSRFLPWDVGTLFQFHHFLFPIVQLGGVVCIIMVLLKGMHTQRLPSLTGLLGYAMMYPLVFIGFQLHPFWFWIVPALHSLQYLLFVVAYKRGEKIVGVQDALPGRRVQGFAVFVALAVMIGAAQFSWLPHALDHLVNDEAKYHLPMLFMALCHLFVNIHHYFIDNVIWRKENPQVRYLFAKEPGGA